MKKLVTLAAVVCLLALAAGSATAATKTWNVSSGNWNTSGNWSPTGIPVASSEIKQTYSGGKCTIPSGYTTADMYRVYVYQTTTPSLTVTGTLDMHTNGQFVKVGFGSSGNQDGIMIQTGTVNLGSSGQLLVGDGGTSRYTGTDGYYKISSGTLTCGEIRLGDRGGHGYFYQTGGTTNAGQINVGYDGNGYFSVYPGALTCTGITVTSGTLFIDEDATCDINGNLSIAAAGTLGVHVAATTSYLDVSGNVTIASGSTLTVGLGISPSNGQEFTIIQSTGGGTISGNFTNLPANWTTQLRDADTRMVVIYTPTAAPLKAFPGAEGYGCLASGGRGGSVYKVTNLNNDGAGSFREAVGGHNDRTVIFSTGGTVYLNTRIDANRINMTIAGQTAPGGGFCLRNGCYKTNSSNSILRHVRFREGDGLPPDSIDTLWIGNADKIIIDHCSASWGNDETLSASYTANNVTVQWCIISEGLNYSGHAYGSLIMSDANNGQQSWHHNLWAHMNGRTPRAASRNDKNLLFDCRYNVIYNTGTSGDYGAWAAYYSGEKVDMNWVGNYTVAGPDTTSNASVILSSKLTTSRIWQSGNKIDSDRDTSHDGVAATWSNIDGTYTAMGSAHSIDANAVITSDTADNAYTNVLAGAGATKPSRDAVDTRIVNNVNNHDGSIINSQDDVGGWPTLAAGSAPTDTDGDGMPDAWESANGTNPNVADNNGDLDGDGYTNLEEYINSL